MPDVLEYAQRQAPHYLLRTLTLSALAPLALVKAWALALLLLIARSRPSGPDVVSITTMSILATALAADIAMIWILTRQWSAARRLRWPILMCVTIAMNLILPVWTVLNLNFMLDPRSRIDFLEWGSGFTISGLTEAIAFSYAILVTLTCVLRDSERLQHQSASVAKGE